MVQATTAWLVLGFSQYRINKKALKKKEKRLINHALQLMYCHSAQA
jgi:hypothetical protein